jgi:hypothetical protein
MSNRLKRTIIVAAVIVGAFGVALGAKAMPISELQSSCTGAGGSWNTWTDYIEMDDGTFEAFEWSTCTYTYSTHTYIETYTDGVHTGDCYKPKGGRLVCNTGKEGEPSPQPTSSGTTGSTSGTYQQPTSQSTTYSGTTSETYSP